MRTNNDATNGVCSLDDDTAVMRPSAHTVPYPSQTTPSRRHVARRRGLSLLLLIPLLVGLFGASATPVGADELADARAKQAALAKQLADQKADIAKINALQADLTSAIASTNRELDGINADLAAVRKSIASMVVKVNVVKAHYNELVVQLADLDAQLLQIRIDEIHKQWQLDDRKALLAERLRVAYDTDRTSLLETFLSGESFTDVLSDVSYSIDAGEQDKALAQQIVEDQATLAAIHQTVLDTRAATDSLRIEVAAQKASLDAQLKQLKSAQARLKVLEEQTKKALAIQKAAYAKLAKNKHNLAKAMAATAAARAALSNKIGDLIAQQYQLGNIPSKYNGTLIWPMKGTVTQEFGCTGVIYEPPLGSCAHFHQGIDIVSPLGCGAPIKASGTGRVAYIGWNYADGSDPAWIVIIAHSSNLATWYAHMRAHTYPGGITTGSVVKQGQVIGYEDTTGHSTGCHLHWMVQYDGSFMNPRLFV
jgi:murein DD-endopeptidase MepM/ murein hydrolase activator NlpD